MKGYEMGVRDLEPDEAASTGYKDVFDDIMVLLSKYSAEQKVSPRVVAAVFAIGSGMAIGALPKRLRGMVTDEMATEMLFKNYRRGIEYVEEHYPEKGSHH